MTESLADRYGFGDISLDDDAPNFCNFLYRVDSIENQPEDPQDEEDVQPEPSEPPVPEEEEEPANGKPAKIHYADDHFIPYDPRRTVVYSDSLDGSGKK